MLSFTPEQFAKLQSLYFKINGVTFEFTADAQIFPVSTKFPGFVCLVLCLTKLLYLSAAIQHAHRWQGRRDLRHCCRFRDSQTCGTNLQLSICERHGVFGALLLSVRYGERSARSRRNSLDTCQNQLKNQLLEVVLFAIYYVDLCHSIINLSQAPSRSERQCMTLKREIGHSYSSV